MILQLLLFFLFILPNALQGLIKIDKSRMYSIAPNNLPSLNEKLTKKTKAPYRKKLRPLANKTIRYMTEQELQEASNISLLLQEFDEALIYLKQLIKVTQSITIAKTAKLQIADIFFQLGNLTEAAKSYDEYILLYPGDKEKVAYASYKCLLSNFYSILPADRDQTATLKTIELADAFLNNKGSLFKIYSQEIISIKNQCFMHLWEHDKVIFEFHMNRKAIKSAHICLADAREKLLPHLLTLEPDILFCEYKVALAENNKIKANQIAKDLESRFHQSVLVAQDKKTIDFTSKF